MLAGKSSSTMSVPPSSDLHVNMIKPHPEEYNTERTDHLSTWLAELHSNNLRLQLPKETSARMQLSQCSKSPVSPFQFDYKGYPHHHLQHDLSFMSNSSPSSNSWSSGEQGSPCNKGHIHYACTPNLQKSSEGEHSNPINNNGIDSGYTPTLQHAFRDISNEVESSSSPRPLNNVIDGKQSTLFKGGGIILSHTTSEQHALGEIGNKLASSLSPRIFNNHSEQSSRFRNDCIHSANAPIQRSPLRDGTNPLGDSLNKLQRSSSPRLPSPQPPSRTNPLGDSANPLRDSINKLQSSSSPRPSTPGPPLSLRRPPFSLMTKHSFNPLLASPPSDAPSLSNALSALHTSLDKARHIQQQIDVSSSKLEYAGLRLPALEVAMGPLSSDSADMRELCSFIDQTTAPALDVLEAFKAVEKLAPVIKAGPASEEDIEMYIAQVSSLENLLRFLHRNALCVVQLLQGAVEMLGGSRIIDKLTVFKFKEILSTIQLDSGFYHDDQPSFGTELLECAAAHLESHFSHILSENTHIIQLPATFSDNPHEAIAPLPETSLHALQATAEKLSSYGKLNQCLCVYEKAREVVIRKSLKTLGVSAQYLRHSSPQAVQGLEWETLEGHISTWLHQMEVVIRLLLIPERQLIGYVFDQCSDSKSCLQWQACFARLALKGVLQHWIKFGISVAQSRKEPQKLFKLLDMFECVEGLRGVVEEDVLSGDACEWVRRHMTTLQAELGKGACKVLRAFGPQVERDRDAVAHQNGGVMKLTSYVVNYVKCLLGESYRPLIESIMQAETRDGDQLKAAMLRLMQALERNVEAKAKGLQESHPALRQLFLMNNHWYIYMRSKNTELATILGTPWLKQHKQRAEKCAMRYRRESWGTLLSVLSGPEGLPLSLGSNGMSRGLLRQRIQEFEEAFVELYQLHESWNVPDPLLRPQLGITVLHSFLPMLSALFGQFAPFLPSDLHITYTPHRIQQMIAALFEIAEANVKPLIPELALAGTPAKLRSFH